MRIISPPTHPKQHFKVLRYGRVKQNIRHRTAPFPALFMRLQRVLFLTDAQPLGTLSWVTTLAGSGTSLSLPPGCNSVLRSVWITIPVITPSGRAVHLFWRISYEDFIASSSERPSEAALLARQSRNEIRSHRFPSKLWEPSVLPLWLRRLQRSLRYDRRILHAYRNARPRQHRR